MKIHNLRTTTSIALAVFTAALLVKDVSAFVSLASPCSCTTTASACISNRPKLRVIDGRVAPRFFNENPIITTAAAATYPKHRLSLASSTTSTTSGHEKEGKNNGVDYVLLLYFTLWFAGNYFYKVTNKLALNAAGGKTGFPMTISALQLGVGSLYAIAATWLFSPRSKRPRTTWNDILRMCPVGFCYLGAHSASLFAFAAGSVSFGEIVKAAEPAFAAVLSQFGYRRPVSQAKWWCLPIIIGGVILASVSDLGFTWTALMAGCLANLFAAVKHNENKKLIEGDDSSNNNSSSEGIKERIGSVRNQFALTTMLAFLMSLPFMIVKEGARFGEFIQLARTTPILSRNVVLSALWFYNYNEVATRTLKKTGPVTSSVANTAKRVLVIVGSALRFGESLSPVKMIGSGICIGGVFLYSIVDKLVVNNKQQSQRQEV